MSIYDYLIFAVYFAGILALGFYFHRRNSNKEDYYVGGRNLSAGHIGLSIVATDVGGGFSIGLGGLGFVMGLAGSWLLFSGLIGAWLTAVLIVPRIKQVDAKHGMLSFPDFLRFRYGDKVALVAAIISGIGYFGFTGAQILAGAKLAAGTVFADVSVVDPLQLALYVMAGIVIAYTVLGGIKAVIYTDTIQWIVLLTGLLFFAIPFSLAAVGGWQALIETLPASYFDLTNIRFSQLLNWLFTIIPIWFIAMTLYQRIYACRTAKEARRAFFIAGLFEYPVMAFLGVFLGMIARVVFPDADPEMGLPKLLHEVLPIGVAGIVIAAYFSTIMSTADSCLIAASGNVMNDLIEKYFYRRQNDRSIIRMSQFVTMIIGALAIVIAGAFASVLEIILHAYSFMVAGLLVPTLAAYFYPNPSALAATFAMLAGGLTALFFISFNIAPLWGMEGSVVGIFVSALFFIIVTLIKPNNRVENV
jgi:SSS family solute:Na+ symporter